MSAPLIRARTDYLAVLADAPLCPGIGTAIAPVYVVCSREVAPDATAEGWDVTSVRSERETALMSVRHVAGACERVTAVAVVVVTALLHAGRGSAERQWYCYGHVALCGYPGCPGGTDRIVEAPVPDLRGLRQAVEAYLSRCCADQMEAVCPCGSPGPQADPMTGPEYDIPAAS